MSYLSIYNKDIFYRNIKNFRKPIDQIGVIDTDLITFNKKFKNYYLYSILPINVRLDDEYHFEQFKKKYKQFNSCNLTIEPNLSNKIQLLNAIYMHKFYKLDCSSS